MSAPARQPKPKLGSLADAGFYTPVEHAALVAQSPSDTFLVQDYIRRRSLTLAVGDSGLGKSPWCYQLAMCVAAGVPFCGLPTEQARVLYADNENGREDVDEIVSALAGYLGLQADTLDDLVLFNRNHSPKDYKTVGQLLLHVKPDLLVLDPLNAWYPDIEKHNSEAHKVYRELRDLMKKYDCAILGVHHPSKEQQGPGAPQREALDEIDDVRRWFNRSRGSSAMINGCDCRIGFDRPSTVTGKCELVVGGYRRCSAAFPLMRLARAVDDDGEPVGYTPVRAFDLLKLEWQKVYATLPDTFHHKDAKALLQNDPYETTQCLKRCVEAGVLQHDRTVPPKGVYRKLAGAAGENSQPSEATPSATAGARFACVGRRRRRYPEDQG